MRRVFVVGLVALAAGFASARPNAQGVARLSGHVIDVTNSRPIARAIVTITSPALARSRSVVADEQGAFAVTDLPAGRYAVTAAKSAYMSSSYGSTRPGRTGTPVTLAAGQQTSDLIIRLGRLGSISGLVRDENGEPMPNVQVSAIKVNAVSPSAQDTVTTSTDDRGAYRIAGVSPAAYVVSAVVPYVVGGSQPGGIGLRSTDEVDAILKRLQSGLMTPSTSPATAAPPSPPRRAYGLPPAYYPGAFVVDDAAPVTVGIGDEISGIDIVLRPMPIARIDGSVVSSTGEAVGNVRLALTIARGDLPFSLNVPRGQPADSELSGRFSFPSVGPGLYTLTARASIFHPVSDERTGDWVQTFARMSLRVSTEDITNLIITVQPGATFAGRIALDAVPGTPPLNLGKLYVQLSPAARPGSATTSDERAYVRSMAGSVGADVRSDGTFEIRDIPPGTYEITAPEGANGWWLRSAIAGGTDLLDAPFDMNNSGKIAGVTITLSNRHAELAGQLQTPSGAPAPDYFVIVFPAVPALWQAGSRRIQMTRPGTDGTFSVKDLPAGDYLVAALTDVEPDEWRDPRFLASLTPGSVKVSLADGSRQTVAIKIR